MTFPSVKKENLNILPTNFPLRLYRETTEISKEFLGLLKLSGCLIQNTNPSYVLLETTVHKLVKLSVYCGIVHTQPPVNFCDSWGQLA